MKVKPYEITLDSTKSEIWFAYLDLKAEKAACLKRCEEQNGISQCKVCGLE